MIRFVFLLIMAVLLVSCAKNATVSNLPPNVTSQQFLNWDKAVKTNLAMSQIIQAGTTTTIQFTDQGTLPKAASIVLLTALKKMAEAGQGMNKFLTSVPNNWGVPVQGQVQFYVTAVQTALGDATDNGLLGVKDLTTQQKLKELLAQIQGSVQIIQGLIDLTKPTARSWIFPGHCLDIGRLEVVCG